MIRALCVLASLVSLVAQAPVAARQVSVQRDAETVRLAQPPGDDHVRWVEATMRRMATVKPGMTRAELLEVFTTEGGLSTRVGQTFVSRDCPYFKVDVTFQPVGRPDPLGASPQDKIVSMTRPYLQFPTLD